MISSYTISPEYYTKFKFIQFGLAGEGVVPPPGDQRMLACIVGFAATWWMGLIGLTGLAYGHWVCGVFYSLWQQRRYRLLSA